MTNETPIEIKRGDICYVNFGDCSDEKVGSEQSGMRPALIIQNNKGNRYSPTTIVVPITSQLGKKRLPMHVFIKGCKENGLKRDSIILCEQFQTIDKKRIVDKIGSVDDDGCIMEDVKKAAFVSLGF